MSNLIRSTAFLRTSDWTLLKLDCFDKGKSKQYEDDLEILIRQIQQTNPRADERATLTTGNGCWRFKLDDKGICYLVLSSVDYPERQSFAMVKEMEKELKKLPDYQVLQPKEVARFIKQFIKDLQDKYNNLTGIDKIAQAQAQIDEVKLVMEDNVKRMLDNNTQIDQLDQRADDMKLKSKQFHQQSTDLAKLMYWRNVKLKLAIAIIVLSILLYITVPLIITATAASNASGSGESSSASSATVSSVAAASTSTAATSAATVASTTASTTTSTVPPP